jgi:lipopolysaccharide biosynthesis glycosyltransferase
MKISIPEQIKGSILKIESINLEMVCDRVLSLKINKIHAEKASYIEVSNKAFEECKEIYFKVKFIGSTTEIIKFNCKQDSVYRGKPSTLKCLRHQVSDLFEDSDEERNRCLDILNEKIQEVDLIEDQQIKGKNLIYYTVYFDNGYCDLLNCSIESLLKKSNDNLNYDILIITDNQTQKIIKNLSFFKKKQPLFHITETPMDGVEASKMKVNIFDFVNINNYENILFIDCDVVFVSDVNSIFKQDLNYNTLYTAGNSNIGYHHHKSFHHGFEFLNEEHVVEMRKAKQMPFNAGQYLFKNSLKMKHHFLNTLWFMKNWSGEYFFEQCFMCYYFCKAYLTDDLLNKYASITSTVDANIKGDLNKNSVFIHFIAPPLNAKAKINFLNDFFKPKPLKEKIKDFLKKIKL